MHFPDLRRRHRDRRHSQRMPLTMDKQTADVLCFCIMCIFFWGLLLPCIWRERQFDEEEEDVDQWN
jgi:hypothetical protein